MPHLTPNPPELDANTDDNLINTWTQDGFTVNLFWRGIEKKYGKAILAYQLWDNDTLVFEASQVAHCLYLAPGINTDSPMAIWELLVFLTLQPGDTDPDYFDSYTPQQLTWTLSSRADDLRNILDDAQNPDDDDSTDDSIDTLSVFHINSNDSTNSNKAG